MHRPHLLPVSVVTMFRLGFTATLLSIAHSQQTFWKESYKLNFNYVIDSEFGPSNWDEIDVSGSEWEQYTSDNPNSDLAFGENECDSKLRPSPIILEVTDACVKLEMYMQQKDSTDCVANDVSFEITPHALRAYLPEDDTTCQRPALQLGGPDANPFVLQWMEIHARSEHVVNGRRFDAELQMVHMGTGGNSDRMLIVSVLMDASSRADHAEFQNMLDQWQTAAGVLNSNCSGGRRLRARVMRKDSARQPLQNQLPPEPRRMQECSGSDCGPRKRMFPYSMWPSIWFYSYAGSLTTPPCSSVVDWRIIDMTMAISKKQYKQLSTLLAAYKGSDCANEAALNPNGENFRPLEEANADNQNVMHCTIDDFSEALYATGEQ